jgi:type III secretory pathway component EscT
LELVYSILPLVMRCFGLVVFLPVSLSIRLSVVVMMVCISYEHGVSISGVWLYLQFLVGAVIGVSLLFIKEGALTLGSLLDAGRGQTLGMILNPVESEPSSPLGGAVSETVWYFCIVKGIIPLAMISYLRSFDVFPLRGKIDLSFEVFGEIILKSAGAIIVHTSPMLLILATIMVLIDFVFLMISAFWKLDGLTPEHNLLRSLLVFFGLSVVLYSDGFDVVSEVLKTLPGVR